MSDRLSLDLSSVSEPARDKRNVSEGEELVRYPAEAPPSEQARLVRRGAHYVIETDQGRVRLTPRQAEVLVGSVSYYELCRDEALMRLRWQVMSITGINSDVFEHSFFYQSFDELGSLRPVDAFAHGRDNDILDLARTIARRNREAVLPPEPSGKRKKKRTEDKP